MHFEKDLFISYAHLDNLPLSPEQQGWITRFHVCLEALLSMRLGQKAEIWRDHKLAGNDIFSDEIISQFPKTAVLVSVVSERYLKSKWCTDEVKEFCKAAEQHAGLSIENKCRIVKILKSPLDSDEPLPAVMKALLGYQFYHLDEDNTPLELDPAYGAEMAQKYNVRMAKLAWEIAQILKLMAKTGSPCPPATEPPSSRPTVYLAECSYDQHDAREAIDAELKCHGYRILPDNKPARDDEATYIAQVTELLEKCNLSVHLVGSNYGAVPDGPSQKSIVVLQNELAMQLSRKKGLRRIIWLPEGTSSKHQQHSDFIRQLQTDSEAQFGADLITSTQQEAIKGAIHAALQKLQGTPASATPAGSRSGQKMIYLICDERDRKSTIPLRKFLVSRGFDVEIPVFEGDAATVRQANQDLIQQSAGVLVFYGEGGDAWKRSVDSELRKLAGSHDAATPFPVYTCLAAPETAAKRDLVDMEEAGLLNCLPGFSEEAVQPFLKAFERSGA